MLVFHGSCLVDRCLAGLAGLQGPDELLPGTRSVGTSQSPFWEAGAPFLPDLRPPRPRRRPLPKDPLPALGLDRARARVCNAEGEWESYGFMQERSKVIDMPEEQLMGALERAVSRLSDDVERVLLALERQRPLRERADELLLGNRPSRRRRNHGIRNR